MGDDVEDKYMKELVTLRMNSKPLINSLTMMAEDFIQSASVITQVIEKHLAKVKPEWKLPILYLIDSIVKNIKKEYIDLFAKNIVSTFCGVFESVEDRNTRGFLFKLRQTWIDVFPAKKLMAIDMRCNDLDEKWPIGVGVSNPATSIHLNPKFLSQGQQYSSGITIPTNLMSSPYDTPDPSSAATEAQMREQLLIKQKQLLELQTKKLELELLQTQARLDEQARKNKLEEQASAKLLAQAEIARQKTLTATSLIARANATVQPPIKHPAPTPIMPLTLQLPVLQEEVVERVSRNPDLYPSDPRIRRLNMREIPRQIPPPPKLRSSDFDVSVTKIPDHPIEVITLSSSSPSRSSPPPISKRRSISPKREKNRAEASRGSSKESQGGSSGRRSAGEGKRSPHRPLFHSEVSSSISISPVSSSSSPEKRANSPKHSEKERTERKRSRGNSKSTTGRKREESEKSERLRGSKEKGNNTTAEKERKSERSESRKSEKDLEHEKFENLANRIRKRMGLDIEESKLKTTHPPDNDIDLRFDNGNSNSRKRSGNDRKRDGKGEGSSKSRGTKNNNPLSEKEKNFRNERRAERERDREQFKSRTSAVLARNYRKRSGIEEVEEEEMLKKTTHSISDTDRRFESRNEKKDVDLRKSKEGQATASSSNRVEPESSDPPSPKKSRSTTSTLIDNLFGREDVDLRQSSSSWSQMKKPNDVERRGSTSTEDILHRGSDVVSTTDDLKDMVRDVKLRPPLPLSPASSVGSTAPTTCDALGRPLAFARLPDDPDERRRSLGSRSASIDPLETFRFRYIETPLKVKGRLDASDLEVALSRSKDEVDQGILNDTQFNIISKQLVQLNEGIKIRKVQEMDTKVRPGPGQNLPNPWNPDVNPIWSVPVPGLPPPIVVNRPEEVMWARGVPRGPNPFVEAINSVPEILIPAVNQRELSLLEMDIDATIPLDKIQRQVRFYGMTAIVFVGKLNDEPREISFQSEKNARTLYINREPLLIRWGITRKFYYGPASHTIRIGAPTRELYIDGQGYEVFFGGGPTRVRIDSDLVSFRLAGPPPSVEIGRLPRFDIVAGRTTVFVDGNPYHLYLDEKPQLLDFGGFPVIAKFCDEFRSITLNGRAFLTNFGGPPRPLAIPTGRRLYIRFNAVSPLTEHNILAYIRLRTLQRVQGDAVTGVVRFRTPGPQNVLGSLPVISQQQVQELPNSANPLDMVANLITTTDVQQSRLNENSYEIESTKSTENTATVATEEEPSSSLNVQDLLSKLMLAGLLPAGGQSTPVKEETSDEKIQDQVKVELPQVTEEVTEVTPSLPPPLPPIEVEDVKFTDNLRKRRPKVLNSLYVGIQCASCGLRFPADQNYRYTQHLDWHFRQNRREKANCRKALSRKWYYDLSDWIQFEEVEDLEGRASSLFEPHDMDIDETGGSRVLDPDSYTVLATGHDGEVCPQCGEGFETFYDEEKEEWRLRDALQDPEQDQEGSSKVYHPICHQDYLRSLVEEEEVKVESATPLPSQTAEEDDEVLILREGPKEVVLMEVDIAEDDGGQDTKKAESVYDVTESLDGVFDDGDLESGVPSPGKPNTSYTVLSPIVIDVMEDENSNIPGMASGGLEGSVFGFALNSNSSQGTTLTTAEMSRLIIYEPMKFDFPKIKEEPIEWKEITEDQMIMSTLFPHISSGAEPMDITLDDEDSGIEAPLSSLETLGSSQPTLVITDIDLTGEDDVESTPAAPQPVVAEIDGNLQFRATDAVTIVPTKIKINIAGFDTCSQSPTHKGVLAAEEAQPPTKSQKGPLSPSLVDKKHPPSPIPPDLETLFQSEDIRLHKPRLFGKKLVNNPVKSTGKEESGLCSIM